jgi:hypothetical protein
MSVSAKIHIWISTAKLYFETLTLLNTLNCVKTLAMEIIIKQIQRKCNINMYKSIQARKTTGAVRVWPE